MLSLQAGQPTGCCPEGPSEPAALCPRRDRHCRPAMHSGLRSEVAKQRLLLVQGKRTENQDFIFS